MRPALLPLLLLLLLCVPPAPCRGQAVEGWGASIGPCPDERYGTQCVHVSFIPGDFVRAFSEVFAMSDGSTPVLGVNGDSGFLASAAMKNVLGMLGDVGVRVGDDGRSLTVPVESIPKVGMLAVLGNFVSVPGEEGVLFPGAIATVVVDVYTGALVVAPPYNVLRQYFLETLLVISVVAIARLSLVRRVTLSALPGRAAQLEIMRGVADGVPDGQHGQGGGGKAAAG